MSSPLSDLEEVGARFTGDQLDPNPQSIGGQTDLVFTRTFKVSAVNAPNYLYQIRSTFSAPATRVMDAKIPTAYLVAQRLVAVNDADMHLVCVFAQLPSTWYTDASYQNVPFPGVLQSSLYTPYDFEFRASALTLSTQTRYEHTYFLGPQNAIAPRPRFKVFDVHGYRTSVIDDNTNPSADEYIGLVNARQEIVIESVVLPWKGDIYDRRTLFALAK